MENAVNALVMAGEILILLVALGTSISSFSQARETAEILVEYSDREYVTQYVEDSGNMTRIVGVETIIPTIYRAYKENYRVLFYDSNGNPIELYTKTENGISGVSVNYIDQERDVLGSDRQKDNFIMALLYGTDVNKNGSLKREDGTTSMTFQEFTEELSHNNSGITLNSQGIYDRIIIGHTFVERYGVYYQEDVIDTSNSDTAIDDEFEDSTTETPDVNKTKKRVISYYMQ